MPLADKISSGSFSFESSMIESDKSCFIGIMSPVILCIGVVPPVTKKTNDKLFEAKCKSSGEHF